MERDPGHAPLGTRIRTALLLYAFAVLGVFLLVAPWTPVWRQATMGLLPAQLAQLSQTGWVRGMVSGIGGLDLFVALQVAGELWNQTRVDPTPRSRR
ncbi:MAG: RNA methyltransferase [bacterium]|nr:RNA methyltransferase [bacterium]